MYEIVTGLPELPVGIWAQAYLTAGKPEVIAGSSQPPSNVIAACFLPSASPHQPSPMSLAVIPIPFLNRSRYHWTAAFVSGVSTMLVLPSSETIEPPWA